MKTLITAAILAMTATTASADQSELYDAGFTVEMLTQMDYHCSDYVSFDGQSGEIIAMTLTQEYYDIQDAFPDFAEGVVSAQSTWYELTKQYTNEGFDMAQSEMMTCAALAAAHPQVTVK